MKLTAKQLVVACGECAHFQGIQHARCKAGVEMATVTGKGSLPCLRSSDKGTVACDLRRWVTPEEAQAEEDDREAWMNQINKALPVVSRCKDVVRKGGKTYFEEPCPACTTGTLHISIARCNLHARVHCTTDGCARWIE